MRARADWLALLLTLALAPVAAAAPSTSDTVRELMEKARQQAQPSTEKPPRTYLGTFSEADVRGAARGPGGPLRWRISEWKAWPETAVALSYYPVRFGGDLAQMQARVALVEKRGDRLAAVANGPVTPATATCENAGNLPDDDELAPDLQLDLGAYTIAPHDTAIGVRFSCHHSFPAGEGSETRLILLEAQGTTLREVLNEPIASSNHDRAGGIDRHSRGVLIVQKTSREGHFDLVIRTMETSESDQTAGAQPAGRRVTTRGFAWAGERYRPVP